MYKYVITFEELKPDLTIIPRETIDPVAFIEKMGQVVFDTSKIKAIVITPFDGQKSVVGDVDRDLLSEQAMELVDLLWNKPDSKLWGLVEMLNTWYDNGNSSVEG